jgi:hypothetical protein
MLILVITLLIFRLFDTTTNNKSNISDDDTF